MIITSDISNLATLLCVNKSLESIPEPYRMQKDTAIVISFEDYCNYIKNVDYVDDIILKSDLDNIREAMSCNDEIACVCYYYNALAKAQMKELFFAERYKEYASIIIPKLPNVTKIVVFADEQNYPTGRNADIYMTLLCEDMARLNLNDKEMISSKNMHVYNLAKLYNYIGASLDEANFCNIDLTRNFF